MDAMKNENKRIYDLIDVVAAAASSSVASLSFSVVDVVAPSPREMSPPRDQL